MDPAAVGTSFEIQGQMFTVIGVADPLFRGLDMPNVVPTSMWVPLDRVARLFKGGTKEQYDATLRAVHTDKDLPDGQVFHAAGPTGDGWIVNDPHSAGAMHQGDVSVIMPTFYGDEHIGWSFANMHVLDVGCGDGGVPSQEA